MKALIIAFIIGACSSSHVKPETPTKEFDASEYVDPKAPRNNNFKGNPSFDIRHGVTPKKELSNPDYLRNKRRGEKPVKFRLDEPKKKAAPKKKDDWKPTGYAPDPWDYVS